MRLISALLLCFVPLIVTKDTTVLHNKYAWLRLPRTPKLPNPSKGDYAHINDIDIWYAVFGSAKNPPVVFLHGGFGNSDYWGLQVRELKSTYRCIVMDSRGQGRSTMTSDGITYETMASDVVGLLDHLDITKAHIVGWSDGGIISLMLAMNYPDRVLSIFAFAANYVPSGTKDVFASEVFVAFLKRTEVEYQTLNPQKDYAALNSSLMTLWSSNPNWSQEDFAEIDEKLAVLIVDGDRDEAIYREQQDTMSSWIPQSGELIIPASSHFAFMQHPEMFTALLTGFLSGEFR